jgi:hypothetical protein
VEPSINLELQQLVEEAQRDRQKYAEGDRALVTRDGQRRTKLQELIKNSRIRTAGDFHLVSYIFELGNNYQDLEAGLAYAQKAIDLGFPPHESLLPQATDRFMIAKQVRTGTHKSLARQRFGTQIALWMDGGKNISFNPLDGTITKEELEKFGLPDSKQFEGKHYQDYLKAFNTAKQKAATVWQSSHK